MQGSCVTRLSSNDSLLDPGTVKGQFSQRKGPSFGQTMSCNEKQLLKRNFQSLAKSNRIMTDAIVALLSLQEAPKESH